MTETVFAVVNADGLVENVIVADQEFIDSLTDAISDPEHDTGELSADHKFVDVTDKDPQPSVGWTRAKNGRFTAPEPPELTEEQQAAREDAAFVAEVTTRLRDGGSLTQDERDRLTLIQLSRD